MANPYLRFEDGAVFLGGKVLMVNSANLTFNTSLSEEKVYGDYNSKLAGANIDFINFQPNKELKGSLSITFYISAASFAIGEHPNNIDRMFEIKSGMSEKPINDNKIGRYSFDGMYLTSFAFELEPFKVIRASASYDIYGTIKKVGGADRAKQSLVNFAHGLKSFGHMLISETDANNAVGGTFEISSLKYKIDVQRKTHYHIRDLEHTSINTIANSATPHRVSVEKIESSMDIDSSEMVPYLNAYGSQQKASFLNSDKSSTISAFLYSLQGDQLARFDCSGKIQNQSHSISEGNYASSSISIREAIK